MTELLQLALRAMDDPDTAEVFGDAVLESGWYDGNVTWLLDGTTKPARQYRHFLRYAGRATSDFARAVAAVLLFGEWSPKRWPGVPRSNPRDVWAALRGLYPQNRVSEALYRDTPLLQALRRESDESMTRLARDMGIHLYGSQPTILTPPRRARHTAGVAPQRWWDGATTRRRGR